MDIKALSTFVTIGLATALVSSGTTYSRAIDDSTLRSISGGNERFCSYCELDPVGPHCNECRPAGAVYTKCYIPLVDRIWEYAAFQDPAIVAWVEDKDCGNEQANFTGPNCMNAIPGTEVACTRQHTVCNEIREDPGVDCHP